MEPPNGRAQNAPAAPSAGAPPPAHRPHNCARDGIEAPRLFAEAVNLRRALAASERRLEAALAQLDSLRRRKAELKGEVAALTETAANARRFAYHDELTGLPNRYLLFDRFNQAVALAARHDKRVGLLFLDLDRFKNLNDALGHSAGDHVLQQVALRLLGCIRASDTVSRYGGDEFVVLLPELAGREGAIAAAEKIRAQLEKPYWVDGTTVTMTASNGLAVYPLDGRMYGDLIHVSDLAMYRHKGRGVTPPIVFDRAPDAAEARTPAVPLLAADRGREA
jgi:diguanylate cyclase (GGDEF)-like protein